MSERDDEHTPTTAADQPTPPPPKLTKKRRRRRKNLHAEIEAERRKSRDGTQTPGRDDVARAALHAVLALMLRAPTGANATSLHRIICSLLTRAEFSRPEVERVIADMVVRADYDRDEWIYAHRFRRWSANKGQGPRPERERTYRGIPRRSDDSLHWTATERRPPGARKRQITSSDDTDGDTIR